MVQQWRAMHAPGGRLVMVGQGCALLLPREVGEELVARLWPSLQAEPCPVSLVNTLTGAGLGNLHDFALLVRDGEGIRCLVRGAVQVSDLDTGQVLADGSGLLTWREASLGEVRAVRVGATVSEAAGRPTLPLLMGAALVSQVHLSFDGSEPVAQLAEGGAPEPDEAPGDDRQTSGTKVDSEPDAEPSPESEGGSAWVAAPEAALTGEPIADQDANPAAEPVDGLGSDPADSEPAGADEPTPARESQAAELVASRPVRKDDDADAELKSDDADRESADPSEESNPEDASGVELNRDDASGVEVTEVLGGAAPQSNGHRGNPAPHFEPTLVEKMPSEPVDPYRPVLGAPAGQGAPLHQPAPADLTLTAPIPLPTASGVPGAVPIPGGGPKPLASMPAPLNGSPFSRPSDSEALGGHDHDGLTIFQRDIAATHKPGPGRGEQVLAAMCGKGHPNPPGSSSCRLCGSAVQKGGPQVVRRPPLATLVASNGESVVLDGQVLVGRAPSADGYQPGVRLLTVPSPNQDISRTHLLVGADGWAVEATDLESTNGTFLLRRNQDPMRLVPGQPVLVQIGDLLDLGDGLTIEVTNPTL